jgi:hypothetical protein
MQLQLGVLRACKGVRYMCVKAECQCWPQSWREAVSQVLSMRMACAVGQHQSPYAPGVHSQVTGLLTAFQGGAVHMQEERFGEMQAEDRNALSPLGTAAARPGKGCSCRHHPRRRCRGRPRRGLHRPVPHYHPGCLRWSSFRHRLQRTGNHLLMWFFCPDFPFLWGSPCALQYGLRAALRNTGIHKHVHRSDHSSCPISGPSVLQWQSHDDVISPALCWDPYDHA